MVIDKNGFYDVNTYVWFLLGKFVPLYLLIIWFLTCRQWWYHVILIPILMYAFQIFEVLYSNDKYIDTKNILWLLPVCMVVIPFVYLIRIKLYDKYVNGIDLEAMESELKELKEKQRTENIPTTLSELKGQSEKSIKEQESLSEDIDRNMSAKNLQQLVKRLRHTLQGWL